MNPRLSSIELLRILSMFFVVLLHFNHWGINLDILSMKEELNVENTIGHFFESIAIVAVNVFVLISGYFGIRFRFRGVLKLYLVCFSWGMISYLLYCLMGPHPIGKALFARIFAFTHNKWWFIIAYLYLYCAAPLLNIAVDHLDRKRLLCVILLYSFSSLYIGYVRGMGDNSIGMSFAQFVLLYLIGRFINKSFSRDFFCKKRNQLIMIWLICTLMTFAMALVNQKWLHNSVYYLRPYLNNSPWVIGASVSLVCVALSYSFKSQCVNFVSGSVLSAYLLQDSSYWGYEWLYPFIIRFFSSFQIGIKYLFLIIISFLFVIVCVLMDNVLKVVFYNPVLKVYDHYLYPIVRSIQSRFTIC